ncbi:hypothetical protein L4C33_14275 [Vibrio makurazakiensis]|uniref:hypothetical protein n=1 Tax=Vibrio makurazakiensis TaxID=2910250 RepID=UPI003D104D46
MKQLKQQYRERIKYQIQYLGGLYPSIRSGTHKHFSTKQEKSYYFLHRIECRGYPIKLRAARGKALPNPWFDYPSYVYDLAKSWKHNSKRQKQYYL